MKFKLFLFLLFFSKIGYSQSEKLDEYKVANIKNVIALFKQKDSSKISNIISFPLRREYPIPNIKDKNEFKQRFSEVFDSILIEKIAHSKIEQWSEVGWRGIMLDDGVIWITSDKGKITAVNYQSDFEKKLRKDLVAKENLHPSLKTFKNPIYSIKTKKFLIRIDELANHTYRYASWKIDEKESSKPDMILNNGEFIFQGSGGNHVITFSNKNYKYKVYRNMIGEDHAADITLVVEKDGQVILTENGTLITK
ncbi:hypothetical protein LZQ00_04630 [Sphingobacterium sp. SRCM116780]|uniref:hypothetical protein n=1 Tax=Sphingobacterium sp. SRCM116780 TaxID=2907623 RepID=UPI001F2A787D|nr:hypothetical protein [Sphingobacterium sp. SRCM116780]UIR57101.1 hypothetical protein LZQ00_04630 [Sphingobacterium sp. SRCM116780]